MPYDKAFDAAYIICCNVEINDVKYRAYTKNLCSKGFKAVGEIKSDVKREWIENIVPCQARTIDNKLVINIESFPEAFIFSSVGLHLRGKLLWERKLTEDELKSQIIIVDLIDVFTNNIQTSLDAKITVKLLAHSKEKEKKLFFLYNVSQEIYKYDRSNRICGTCVLPAGTTVYSDSTKRPDNTAAQYTIVPFFNINGHLAILTASIGNMEDRFMSAVLSDIIYSFGEEINIFCKIRKGNRSIKDFLLCYPSVKMAEDLISIPFDVTEDNDFYSIKATIDLNKIDFKIGNYVPALIVSDAYGDNEKIQLKADVETKSNMSLKKQDIVFSDYYNFCTIINRDYYVSFAYQKADELDSRYIRRLEKCAYKEYIKDKSYWDEQKIILMYDPNHAQDNTYHLFRYIMDNAPEDIRKRVFYVTKESNSDYSTLQVYKSNLVAYGSKQHMILTLAAARLISSQNIQYMYYSKFSLNIITSHVRELPFFFLQHGINGLKSVSRSFANFLYSARSAMCTSSRFEQDLMAYHVGWPREKAPILGMPRYDYLVDKSDPKNKVILFMATWRPSLTNMTSEEFRESEYFKAISSLFKNEKLNLILEKNNIRLKFYMHQLMHEQFDQMTSNSFNVEIIDYDTPLDESLMSCSMIITDFSSTCFDVLYQNKPVIFYQWDQAEYFSEVGIYMNLKDFPGPICLTEDDLLKTIEAYIENDCKIEEKYSKAVETHFAYRDRNNCKRVYEYLCENGWFEK